MSIKEKLKRLSRRTDSALSEEEKASMKREFSAYMDLYPVRDGAIAPPQTSRLPAWMQPSFAAVGIAVATVFTVGASEFSLPNDSLYAVKTGINERVLLASTYFSPILHAEAGHTVFARRLEEAEQLMILEQFRAETADEVQTNIDRQAAALNHSIARAEAAGEVEEANEIRAELSATLEEYDPLLDILALRKEVEDPETIDAFISEVVREHVHGVRPDAAKEAFSEIKLDIMDEYADELLEDLKELNGAVSARIEELDADATVILSDEAVAKLAASNDARAAAEKALAANDPETALVQLEEAILATESVLVEIGASVNAQE